MSRRPRPWATTCRKWVACQNLSYDVHCTLLSWWWRSVGGASLALEPDMVGGMALMQLGQGEGWGRTVAVAWCWHRGAGARWRARAATASPGPACIDHGHVSLTEAGSRRGGCSACYGRRMGTRPPLPGGEDAGEEHG